MRIKSNFVPKQTVLSVTIAAVLGSVSPMVTAATLNATADFNVGDGAMNDSDGPSAVSVDILDSANGSTGDVFYHTYGNAAGTFGSRVSGNNNFDITSTFSFNETYSNNSGAAQNYFFDFTIIPGSIRTDMLSAGASATDNLFSSYDIDIMLTSSSGTTTIFDSAADINTDVVGSVFTQTGTSLGGILNASNNDYSWGQYMDTLALGSFGDGDSFSIDYTLTTTASGMINDLANANCFGGEGGDGRDDGGLLADVAIGGGCSALARSGDPFSSNLGGNTFSITARSAVPAPGVLWLVGSGLAGMLVFRSRKNT